MRKVFISIAIILYSMISSANIYYVSSSGLDSNNGTTISTPWKSITKVNSTVFTAGDRILFKRGDTFTGTLNIIQSGTVDSPIIYSAYDIGDNPIITGFNNVSNFTNIGNNIWESNQSVSTLNSCNIVIINNINTAMGRFPNIDYLTYQTHTGNTSITSSDIGIINWTGSEAIIKTQRFSIDREPIISQVGNTLTLKAPTICIPSNNYGFFIQNDIRTLDQQNEWYFNPITKKLSIYSVTAPVNIQVQSIDRLINIKANNIIISDITLTGGNYGIYHWLHDPLLSNITIQNCKFNFIGIDAINVQADKLTINNNTISDSNNKAIDVSYSTNLTISNNNISNSGVLNGMFQTNGNFSAIQLGGAGKKTSVTVNNNVIYNTGHNGMTIGADSSLIKNNYIYKFCTLLDDGGGIYGGNNSIITGNIITNGIGDNSGTYGTFPNISAGIYMDINSTNIEISNNFISDVACYGIFSNVNLHNIRILGNTVINASDAQLRINYQNIPIAYGYVVKDNIFVSKLANQYTAYYNSVNNNIVQSSIFSNNCYTRPINETKSIQASQPSEYGGTYLKSLSDWKIFTNQDKTAYNSGSVISNENDISYYYNETNNIKTIIIKQTSVDIKGNIYTGSVNLQPFSSLILIKK